MGIGIHHHHAGFGFHHDAFDLHHGIHVGVGLGFLPFYGPWTGYAYPYYGDPYARGAYPDQQPYTRGVAGPRIAVSGPGGAGDSLVVEELETYPGGDPEALVRVSWLDGGRQAEEVALFLADSAQSVLAVQTVRAPPYTALFEPPDGAVFAGVTVVWPAGTKSTSLVAFRKPPP
ncbi:MAG: hypothetical protein ACREOF_14190 [Gemmatimonadales bacterium]